MNLPKVRLEFTLIIRPSISNTTKWSLQISIKFAAKDELAIPLFQFSHFLFSFKHDIVLDKSLYKGIHFPRQRRQTRLPTDKNNNLPGHAVPLMVNQVDNSAVLPTSLPTDKSVKGDNEDDTSSSACSLLTTGSDATTASAAALN